MESIRQKLRWIRNRFLAMWAPIRRRSRSILTSSSTETVDTDDLEAYLPTANGHAHNDSTLHIKHRKSDSTLRFSPEPVSPVPTPASPTSEKDTPSSPESSSKGRELWKNAFRGVRLRTAVTSPLVMGIEPHRRRTTSSNLTGSYGDRKRTTAEEPFKAILRSRVAALVPKLRTLDATQDLAAHQALVRHLQFSPDGRFLATSRFA